MLRILPVPSSTRGEGARTLVLASTTSCSLTGTVSRSHHWHPLVSTGTGLRLYGQVFVLSPMAMILLMIVIALPLASSSSPVSADTHCHLTASVRQPQRVVAGRAAGLLNGMNLTAPADELISPLKFSMWRGPIASWLWPGRGGCTGAGTCCTPASCAPPFAEAERLARFGLRQQYIASGLLTGQGGCEWQSINNPLNPHNCSLPGGPSDPAFKLWTDTIQSAANEAKRRGLAATDFYLDVWNEPNAQHKVQCLVNSTTGPPCVFDANLTQSAFFKIWDVAHRTLREAFPGARLVGPSLADGGPGLYGFERSVFPWLQAFLQHTHAAGTSPDVLTWHVSTLHQNASALVEHHRMLNVWATAAGITLPAIGHNEIVGPAGAVSPAANFGFLSVLEQLQADHSVKACYPDPVTKQSPCWDNTLDGLLTDDCMKDAGPLRASCDTLERRPVYFAYKWYADAIGSPLGTFEASPGCGPAGTSVGLVTGHVPTHGLSAKQAQVLATVVFGQWSEQRRPTGYKTDLQALLRVELDTGRTHRQTQTQTQRDIHTDTARTAAVVDGEVLTVVVSTPANIVALHPLSLCLSLRVGYIILHSNNYYT